MPEIVRVRKRQADDRAHDHIDLVGYFSPHIEYEPIMISIERCQEKMALERFWTSAGDEEATLVAGKCHVCGHEPYLGTDKDPAGGNLLLGLQEG